MCVLRDFWKLVLVINFGKSAQFRQRITFVILSDYTFKRTIRFSSLLQLKHYMNRLDFHTKFDNAIGPR